MHRKCTRGQVNHILKKNDDSPTKSCVKSWCRSSDLNFRPSVLNGLFDMFKRQNVNCPIDIYINFEMFLCLVQHSAVQMDFISRKYGKQVTKSSDYSMRRYLLFVTQPSVDSNGSRLVFRH